MPHIFQYLLKLSISLAFVYLFYQVVLRRLTFYNWNRWYLMGYSLLSFFISFVDVANLLNKENLESGQLIRLIPAVESFEVPDSLHTAATNHTLLLWEGLLLCFCTGIVIAAGRLGIQILSYRKLRRSALLLTDDAVKIFQISKKIIPFSFGKSIFINRHLHTEEELKEIIRHEFIHVKQAHTIDIIWAEILCILNWYNPFAWLLRHHIRQNLEFIADDKVVQSGIDKKEYQYLLLKVIGVPQFHIANSFNFSSLKKRIVMMNKLKTAKVHLVKFLFAFPLLAVLVIAFRSGTNDPSGLQAEKTNTISTLDTIPLKDTAVLDKKLKVISDDLSFFLKQNPKVKGLAWTETSVFVHYKKGGYREYKLNDKAAMELFVKLYGELPQTPPHVLQLIEEDKIFKNFIERNPGVRSIGWQQNPRRIIVYLKDGNENFSLKTAKQDSYLLDDKEDMQRFADKYGPLPTAPPPPPPKPPKVDISNFVPPASPKNERLQQLQKKKAALQEAQQFLQSRISDLNDSLKKNQNDKSLKNIIDFLHQKINSLKQTSSNLENTILHLKAVSSKNSPVTLSADSILLILPTILNQRMAQ